MTVSARYRRMAAVYRVFANDWADCVDLSDSALQEMCEHESSGAALSDRNGFALGKKWLNLHVTTWKQDIRDGLLFKHELYADPKFPHWWLDRIFAEAAG